MENLPQKQKGNHTETTLSRRRVIESLGIIAGVGLLSHKSAAASTNEKSSGEVPVIHFDSLIKARQNKKIIPGSIVVTFGYYQSGDGGAACYRAINGTEETTANNGDVVQFENGVVGLLSGVSRVNYKMFGALCDGKSDDGVPIKIAHEFANRNRLPVEVLSGEFHIEQTRGIPIKTPVNWGQSAFHINEAFNTREPVFVISGFEPKMEIPVDDSFKKAILERLKPGVQQIPELKEFGNHLVWIRDSNDGIGHRYGEAYKGRQSRGREELFYVEADGRIVGDIAWTFNDFTDLVAYPAENSYLSIEGGSFYLSGENLGRERKGYQHNGFLISRSRTIIRNQWVGLEKWNSDTAINPRSGFYFFSNVFDTTLENIRLIPWEYNRPGKENDVYAGTYGIGGNRMMNTTFKNITAEGTPMHWGVFGTNMNKNFRVENCRLNRIDVHFHCWNLSISDSHIGNKGITLTGGGKLLIENTVCDNNRFVNFRNDFGAKWDGDIIIANSRLRPNYSSETSLLFFVAANFDYGYPIGMAKSIVVENFIFDYSTTPTNINDCWLIRSSSFSVDKDGRRSFFPEQIHFRNVSSVGRDKGVKLMRIADPQGYLLPRPGSCNEVLIEPNALITFENIQLEKIDEEGNSGYHLQFEMSDGPEYDSFSLYPKINIKNCTSLAIEFDKAAADVLIDGCTVARINSDSKLPGEITFANCKFVPAATVNTKPYQVASILGTSFINCTFHLMRNDRTPDISAIPFGNLIDLNRSVRHNHINSRLGNDVLNLLKQHRIKLKPEFIAQLKTHNELEDVKT